MELPTATERRPESGPQRPWQLLALSDGNPGHYNQTRGVLKALTLRQPCAVTWIEVRFRAPGVLRRLLTRHAGLVRTGWYRALLRACYRDLELPDEPPDLVLSSGGRTALLNLALGRQWRCPTLFVGELAQPLQPRFDWLLQYGTARRAPNLVDLDLVPSTIHPPDLATAAQHHFGRLPQAPTWALFVGGNSRSHRYSERDWQRLASGVNRLAERHGVRWLVTTSRRTGPEIEALLEAGIDPRHLHEATWYGQEPRPVIAPYLGAAERVFCTQDSLTMLSESACANRPTYALLPEGFAIHDRPDNDFHRYIESLVARRLIYRVPIAGLAKLEPGDHAFNHRQRPFLEELGTLLEQRVLARLRR